MKYQIITGHYTNSGRIRVYARGEDNKRYTLDVAGFKPYSAVLDTADIPDIPEIVETESSPPGLYGEKLQRLIYRAPGDVPDVREHFDKRWEDDVRFVRRMQIDTGVHGGFSAPSSKIVHYTDLKPIYFTLPPVRAFWDIECYSRSRIPDPAHPDQKITCVCFWDDIRQHYISILLDDTNKTTILAPDWTLYHLDSEKRVLQMAVKYLEHLQPDILAEWGRLDKEYFPPRAKIHKINTSVLRSLCTFDMLPAYQKLYHKGSGRLKDVALDEKIIDYVAPEVNFAELWDNDRMALVTKNKLDVEWIVKLNDIKNNMLGFYWNLKNYVGLEDVQSAIHHGILIDTLELRKYHGKYTLPSKPLKDSEELKRRKEIKLIGAIVKKPPSALLDNVACVDFSRYYQNLLIGILSKRKEDWVVPLSELAQDLQDYRDQYDKMLEESEIDSDEYKAIKGIRNAVKYAGEALIGSFGDRESRLFNPDLFDEVLGAGRSGLLHAEHLCERMQKEVLYYDTDGVDVKLETTGTREDALKEANIIVDTLNAGMIPWCEEHGIGKELKLKIDHLYARILYAGVKKRKAAHVIWEDGKWCDYLLIKGFEYIRRDSSLVTREVQREVFEHLLRRGMEGLKDYLSNVINSVSKRTLREVAINKGVKKRFSQYKVKPDFVRGSIWANKHLNAGIHANDQVKMIFVKRTPGYPSTNVVCFLDEDIIPKNFIIDWEKIIDRTIKGKVDDYIKQGGLSWEMVMGMKKAGSVFG